MKSAGILKELLNRVNVVYHRFIATYDSDCQIFCIWSRLKPVFTCQHTKVSCRR